MPFWRNKMTHWINKSPNVARRSGILEARNNWLNMQLQCWRWHQSVWRLLSKRAVNSSSRRNHALRRFWRRRGGLCLAWHQCLISSSHLQALVHLQLYCWVLDMVIKMTRLQVKRNRSSLNYHLLVDSFCKFFVCLNISIFLVRIYYLEPPSPFW